MWPRVEDGQNKLPNVGFAYQLLSLANLISDGESQGLLARQTELGMSRSSSARSEILLTQCNQNHTIKISRLPRDQLFIDMILKTGANVNGSNFAFELSCGRAIFASQNELTVNENSRKKRNLSHN